MRSFATALLLLVVVATCQDLPPQELELAAEDDQEDVEDAPDGEDASEASLAMEGDDDQEDENAGDDDVDEDDEAGLAVQGGDEEHPSAEAVATTILGQMEKKKKLEKASKPTVSQKYYKAKQNLLVALKVYRSARYQLLKVMKDWTKVPGMPCNKLCQKDKKTFRKKVRKAKALLEKRRAEFNAAHWASVVDNELIYKKKYPPLWRAKRRLVIVKWKQMVLRKQKPCSVKCFLKRLQLKNKRKKLERKIANLKLMIKLKHAGLWKKPIA